MMADVVWLLIAAAVIVIAAAPGLAALNVHVRALERRIDDLEALRLLDAAEQHRQYDELIELRRGVALLVAQLRRANMAPEWQPSAAVPAPPPTSRQQAEMNAQVVLWQQIAAQFDLEEQAELWFEMGWASAMRGETAGERARALVAYAARRGCLDKLAEMCRGKRPNGGF